MGRRVLVISPHPDDEAIGCGGSLRRHVVDGDRVEVLFLTSGEQGGHGLGHEQTQMLREREARKAAGILGVTQIVFWREKDGRLRASNHLVERLAATIDEFRPDVIYAPNEMESHPDHRAAARLVRSASRVAGTKPPVLMFEVWTPVTRIDEVVDITPYLETKLAAIRAYRSQCKELRFDEAMLGLARYRGEMFCWPKEVDSNPGKYAEVFKVLRE